MTKPLILDLDFPQLEKDLTQWGEPSYRARQIWQGLYRNLWNSFDEFSNLPKSLRDRLSDQYSFSHITPAATRHSADAQTTKTLFRLPSNEAIEAVLMRYNKRNTLCISTQAGCAMGCVFCATGQMGFRANLTSGEIVEQVLYYARLLQETGERPTNVVVMGMGEPFHNYDATMQAIDRLNDHDGFDMSTRRFTISTVGLIPMIYRFAKEKRQINLAISLHAAGDDLRSSMLPINRKYPIRDLLEACREYVKTTGRRITFEWALIRDVNDTPEQAKILSGLLAGMNCHVNVIPLNPTLGYNGKATTRRRAEEFRQLLEESGTPCTIRMRRGIDIQAGCGQLAVQNDK